MIKRIVPPVLSTETLVALVSLYIMLFGNLPWWQGVLAGRSWNEGATWLFALCVGIAIIAVQYVLLVLIAERRIVRLWLTVALIATGAASFYMRSYAALLDPTMMRNVWRTDLREASDLISWSLILQTIAFAAPAVAFVWWAELRTWSWARAAGRRLLTVIAALVVAALALLVVNRDFTSLMRNQRELRYLVTPANLVYSTTKNLVGDASSSVKPRLLVGGDAKLGQRARTAERPVALVVVIGETARAANFSLYGYERQTNPELSQLDVVAFQNTRACGTSTEISLPCMFSSYGRAEYDEDLIHRSDGLLQIVARTPIKVLWRDNQSGCKGVCDGAGIDARRVDPALAPQVCKGDECLDEILVEELKLALAAPGGSRLIVLHQMGNHGPAYFERYPARLERFTPTCDTSELRRCTQKQVVNTYDNGILYTDEVLARAIGVLQQYADQFDTALLYVSDHGESLGEGGFYLHGIPYPIAPDVQLEVPMLYWMSKGFSTHNGLAPACVRSRALQPASHDNLFDTVLGLLDVETRAYKSDRDLFASCRAG